MTMMMITMSVKAGRGRYEWGGEGYGGWWGEGGRGGEGG